MTHLTYFAHPIDQADSPSKLVSTAVVEIARAGVATYRPGNAFMLFDTPVPSEAASIDAINRRAIEVCTSIFAVLPAGVPTLGVPAEIERFLAAGKPTVILTDLEGSVQIEGWAEAGAHVFNADTLPRGFDLAQLLHGPTTPTMPWTYANPRVTVPAPSKAYPDDAGFDLSVSEPVKVEPGESKLLPTGVRVAIPHGYWGLIVGRSSTWHRRKLMTIPGVIDAGWRGELFVSVHNFGIETQDIAVGERLGQLIILPAWLGGLNWQAELPPHERGTNGFGSSGR